MIKKVPVYHESYNEEENQTVDNYFQTATCTDLAYAIDFLSRNVYAEQDDKYLSFYEKQINRLQQKERIVQDISNIKKDISYEEDLRKYEAFNQLRPILLEEYKKLNRGKGAFNRDAFYDMHLMNILKKHDEDVGVAFLSRKEMKQIMARAGSKTAYKKPLTPNKSLREFTDIEVLEFLGKYLLQYILEVMVYYLDADDISPVYVTLLFIVASQLNNDPPHHKKEECPVSGNRVDITKLLNEYKELMETLEQLKDRKNPKKSRTVKPLNKYEEG